MRLWSIHPKYLDPKGLVALWREALLAQAVLAEQTRGYKNHPQLARFRASSDARAHIARYLRLVHAEACARGYCFDESKIAVSGDVSPLSPLVVTRGQLQFEWKHLAGKLKNRAPEWFDRFSGIEQPDPHPGFIVIDGDIEYWEIS